MASKTTKDITQVMAWTICVASIIFVAFLTVAGSIKVGSMFFDHSDGSRCISKHQEVAQVNSYGKRAAVTVCDQFLMPTSH